MAVTNPRNRTLIFRVTQDEYESLQAASMGARSLSDFARARLLDSVGSRPLDRELTELRSTVERLAGLLEKQLCEV